MSRYNPIHYVPQIKSPVLLVAATKDDLCPISVVHRAASLNANIQLLEENVGAFLHALSALKVVNASNAVHGASMSCYSLAGGHAWILLYSIAQRIMLRTRTEREVCCAGHFEVYLGDLFDQVSAAQARFFVEKLGATVPIHEPAEVLPLL